MTPPAATTTPAPARARPRQFDLFLAVVPLLALVSAACATGPDQPERGRLDEAQQDLFFAAVSAFAQDSPDYPALRQQVVSDPAVTSWFVRYLEIQIVRLRDARTEPATAERLQAETRRGAPDLEPVLLQSVRRSTGGAPDWQLRGERPEERAVRELVGFGAAAVPPVVDDLLLRPQEFLRAIGIDLLAAIGDPAVPSLLERARQGDPAVQRVVARALGAVAKPGVDGPTLPVLRELLASADWMVRAGAVEGLATGGPGARDLLVETLGDGDAFVACKAAASLAGHPDKAAAVALVDYLERCVAAVDARGVEAAQGALRQLAGVRRSRPVAAWREWLQSYEGAAARPSEHGPTEQSHGG